MRGVYITTNVSSIDGKSKLINIIFNGVIMYVTVAYHSSVITFNNGGSWNLISPPEDTDCVRLYSLLYTPIIYNKPHLI